MSTQSSVVATTNDKRRLRGEKSKQAIIDSAIRCIATQGLRNATLDKVAQRARVSRALLVFHFKSKIGMLTAVLKHMHHVYVGGWALARSEGESTADHLLALLEYDIRFACEHPDLLAVWHAFWGEARGSTLYREIGHPSDKGFEDELSRLLSQLADEGGYGDIDIAATQTALWAMLFGLWRNTHLLHDDADYDTGMKALRFFLSRVFPNHF